MAIDGLLAVGGILSGSLGISGLILLKRQTQEIIWNKMIAGQLICWIFVCKGISNSVRSLGFEGEFSRFVLLAPHFSDLVFSGCIVMLALVFPVPLLRDKSKLKIGCLGLVAYVIIQTICAVTFGLDNAFASLGESYIIPGFIWTVTYVKFRFMKNHQNDEQVQQVADLCIFLIMLVVGHLFFRWVGMYTGAPYFYFMDLYPEASFFADYLWNMGLASAAIFGTILLIGEVYSATQGRIRFASYFVFTYMIIGMVTHIILSGTGASEWGGGTGGGVGYTFLQETWSVITASLHFTMMRPILGMFILFRFGIIRISEENQQIGRTMAIVLIVVATSALLEIVQSLMPITEMLSAGILGIAIAFGIGWEERSFESLVANPKRFPLRAKGNYFPEIEIKKDMSTTINKVIGGFLIFIVILSLILDFADFEVTRKILEG